MAEKIDQVVEKYRDRLMEVEGVAGVAEGAFDGKPCIRVFVTGKSLRTLKKIPAKLGGFAVCIEETGQFKALS